MQRDDEDLRRIHETFANVPLYDRAIALAMAAIEHDPRAPAVICFLLALTKVMAKHLPKGQRTAVRWHLQEALEEIGEAKLWN